MDREKLEGDTMYKEWQAWQRVVITLRGLGIDIDKQDGLAKALTTWGDEWASLRLEQARG